MFVCLRSVPKSFSSRLPPLYRVPILHHLSSRAMSGFPFDRKAMEAERLARLASRKKREHSISPPPTRRPPAPLQESATTLSSGARLNLIYTQPESQDVPFKTSIKQEQLSDEVKSKIQPLPSQKPDPALKFPRGVIKKTWAFRHDRKNDIKLEEVLEAATLKIAVLSAFRWDTQWLMPKLNTPGTGGQTKCVFVMEAKTEELREQMRKETEEYSKFLQLCFPPMDGVWCMHSKLMLLFHPTKLRVAIPTANLLPFDWGEPINPGQGGIMENSVFLIDLPRLPESVKQNADELPQFAQELLFFIEKQNFPQNVQEAVLKFDFSATKDMAFVHTVGGSSSGHDAQRTGLMGLSKAVRDLGLASTPELELDFAASSIGALKEDYLRKLHAAACGQNLLASNAAAEKKARDTFFQKPSDKKAVRAGARPDILLQIRIYFPTAETVKASTAGNVGTICLQRKWFEDRTFPRAIFRDYRSTRPGLVSHNKILCARGIGQQGSEEGYQPKTRREIAWVYVGSANMSPSAWGTIGKDLRGKMSCRNWECGVLMPVPSATRSTEGMSNTVIKKEDHDDEAAVSDVGHASNVGLKCEEDASTDSNATESDAEGGIEGQSGATILATPASEEGSETESDEELAPPAKSSVSDACKSSGATGKRKLTAIPDTAQIPEMSTFSTLFDLPFVVPAEEYNGREPWYFMENA